MSRILYILGLIALLVQCFPASTCAIETVVLGSNCHSVDSSQVTSDDHDSVPSNEESRSPSERCLVAVGDATHNPDCACLLPKQPVERLVKASFVPDFNLLAAIPFQLTPAPTWQPLVTTLVALEPPPIARSMPLVI